MELLAIIIALESLKIEPMEVMVFQTQNMLWNLSIKNGFLVGKKNNLRKEKPDLWKRYLLMHRKQM